MTTRQMFKFAFISKAIEQGHTTPQAILDALEKQAFGVGDIVGGLTSAGVLAGGALALAPPVIGAAVGSGAGHLVNQMDDYDEDDALNDELVDEYRRQASLARRKAMLNQHATARQRSGRVYL